MEQKTILLIDDDPIIREIIKDALVDYLFLEASSHSEALTFLNQHIDLALIDYILPDADGFETLRELRKVFPKLPVIIMTAYGSENVVIKAMRSEVTDYLSKPLKLSYLKLRISEILGGLKHMNHHEYIERERNRVDFLLDKVAMNIEENFMKTITLDTLARTINMDKFRFCKAFKEKFGQNFTSYLKIIRIKNAAELLRKTDLNVTEIAYVVGYKNIVHFDRVFKEVHGMSPSEYRKNFY